MFRIYRKSTQVFAIAFLLHNSVILSFHSLSYDRSIAFFKARFPQSAIECFTFKFPVSFHFDKVIQHLLTFSSLSSRHFYPSLSLSLLIMYFKSSSYTRCDQVLLALFLLLYVRNPIPYNNTNNG